MVQIKQQENWYIVKESGANITRLLQHLQEGDVAFISASRHDYPELKNSTNKEQDVANLNNINTAALSRDIHNAGYSYIKVKGGYKEEDPTTGQLIPVSEDTFAVINQNKNGEKSSQDNFFKHMLGLCDKYNQDAVLIAIKDNPKYPIASYDRSGNIVYGPFNDLNFKDVEDFFTSIHGHKFIFENTELSESEDGVNVRSMGTAYQYHGTRNDLEKRYNKNNTEKEKQLSENANTNLKKALIGKNPYVESVVLISAENPMAIKQNRQQNKDSSNRMKEYLKHAHFHFHTLNGKYGNDEHSFVIYNISRIGAESLAKAFNQESFIFGKKSIYNDEYGMLYEFWQTNDGKQYTCISKSNIITNESKAENYFTRLNDYKFSIGFDFTESLIIPNDVYNKLKMVENQEDLKWLREYINDEHGGMSGWMHYRRLYERKQ